MYQHSHKKLLPKYQNKLRKVGATLTSELSEKSHVARSQYISSAYTEGAKGFVERVKKYGVTEKGEPVEVYPWFEDILLIVGDLRIHHTFTSGCSQAGKTLSNTLFIVDCIAVGKLNAAWVYDSAQNMQHNQPTQFRPVMEGWLARMEADGHTFKRDNDRKMTSRYTLEGANGIFAYASTSKPSLANGKAAAGSAVVSFQADIAFLEERSQWSPGSADPIARRLDHSCLKTRPQRDLGTKGSGNGIENEIKTADYIFYPHFTCDNCQKTLPLHPEGCLLRPTLIKDALGRDKNSFFSESGRPIKWWHSDENDPVGSAYFGCSSCGYRIRNEQRQNSRMYDLKTGVFIEDFLAGLGDRSVKKRLKVATEISPLCRITEFNLASELIQSGQNVVAPDDWQQQALGLESRTTTNSITIEMLERCIQAPYFRHHEKHLPRTYKIAGLDPGRGQDWVMVIEYVLPLNYKRLNPTQIIEQTIRNVLYGGDVIRTDIPGILKRFGVNKLLLDNEPDIESASRLCRELEDIGVTAEMADQKDKLDVVVKKSEVMDGGRAYPCYKFRNSKFKTQVLETFLFVSDVDQQPLLRLPDVWSQDIGNKSERSPIRHFTGVFKDAVTGWQRDKAGIDDLFNAFVFAECLFYLQLDNEDTLWLGAL